MILSVYAGAVDAYRAVGWPSILPLPPGQKKSPPAGYTGRDGIIPDDAQYEEWKLERADGNVAVRVPPEVIGIDVDHYERKLGAANLEQFAADNDLPALPATWRSSARPAPSGILFFRVVPALLPEGSSGWVSEICSNVEMIQEGHRYAVVWPSLHPRGTQYNWYRPNGELVEDGTVPAPEDLPYLPVPWIAYLAHGAGGRRTSGTGSSGSAQRLSREESEAWAADHPSEDGIPWDGLFRTVIDRLNTDAQEQTRHAAMLRATSIVVGDIAAKKMPGKALFALADEMRSLTEISPPLGKDAKPWAGEKETAFWAAVGGAIPRYGEDGDWQERIAGDLEAADMVELLADAFGEVRTDGTDVAVEEVEPPSFVPPQYDHIAKAPEVPGTEHPPIDTEAVVDAVVQGSQAEQELVGGLDPAELSAFREILSRNIIERFAVRQLQQVVFDFGNKDTTLVDSTLPRITSQDILRMATEAKALVRSRRSIVWTPETIVWEHWIEDDWLPKSALVSVVAKPSVGKSIFLIDMACHIALGEPWYGSHVQQAPVLYCAFEAPDSIGNRVVGWSMEHREIVERVERDHSDRVYRHGAYAVPTGLVIQPMVGVSLRTKAGRDEIIRQLREMIEKLDKVPGVVIVDTLAQAFGEGNESSTEDMSALVAALGEFLNEFPKLTIVIAHHTVKSLGDGEHGEGRGSGALHGAVSVSLSLRKIMVGGDGPNARDSGHIEVKRIKARDGEAGLVQRGVKRLVHLVDSDGAAANYPSGKPVISVVWGVPTPEEVAQVDGEILGGQAQDEIDQHQPAVEATWAVLRALGWKDGDPWPRRGECPTQKNVASWMRDSGVVLPSDRRGFVLTPAIKEVQAEVERLAAPDPHGDAEGID